MDADLVDAVKSLHADFAVWLRSQAPVELFERLAAAQHERFTMVMTSGEVLNRDEVIAGVRGAANTLPGLDIEISEVEELVRSGDTVVVRFLETHRVAKTATRRRVTAVLTTDDPSGIRWLAVHETEAPSSS